MFRAMSPRAEANAHQLEQADRDLGKLGCIEQYLSDPVAIKRFSSREPSAPGWECQSQRLGMGIICPRISPAGLRNV